MADSKIEWTDKAWNPVTGCTKVSPGCANCYAERQFPRTYPGRDFVDVVVHANRIDQPLHWGGGRRVFVNSMSDLFHEAIDTDTIAEVWRVMRKASAHTFQILTKRPERMKAFICSGAEVLSNVWLGVSVEDQKRADERIPILLQTPATVRFVSAEPLLGGVDIRRYLWPACWHWAAGYDSPESAMAAGAWAERRPQALVSAHREFVRWVIVGGESGPKARPMHLDWARSVVEQCRDAGVPCFVKQLGRNPIYEREVGTAKGGCPMPLDLKDAKGGDMDEWPADLRVREYPGGAR